MIGPWFVDAESNTVRCDGRIVRLEPKVMGVCVSLASRAREVVGKEELIRAVWPDTFVTDDVLIRAISELRRVLDDDAKNPSFIETISKRGYRLIAPVRHDWADLSDSALPTLPRFLAPVISLGKNVRISATPNPLFVGKRYLSAALLTAALGLLPLGIYWRFREAGKLTVKDTVVVSGFSNSTADSVFDGALRQALSVQLEQSPFLSLVSDDRIQQTLRLMGKPPDTPLTPEIAQEICARTGSAAALEGAISQIGGRYLLTVRAVDCANADSLASTEAQAADKNDVIDALGRAGTEIRRKLGESLGSVQKFDAPLAQATTSSLEALKAFTLAGQSGGVISDIPFLQHAVELDPNFALAYAALSDSYVSNEEAELASQYAQKAFDLRGRVTERERLRISSTYYYSTLGDLDKELSVYPIWEQMYPRDWGPWVNSASSRLQLGDYQGALREAREALRLCPGRSTASIYGNLGIALLSLNRGDEAKEIAEQAIANGLDIPDMHILIYRAAFLDNDTRQMEAQLALLFARPEDSRFDALCAKSSTEAYFGRLRSALGLSRQGFEIVQKSHYSELAAEVLENSALLEAEVGNLRDAKRDANAGLTLSSGRNAKLFAALALARAGDTVHAQALADQLNRQFPSHTILQHYWLPTLRGSIELARKNPAQAVEALHSVSYELGGAGSFLGNLYPAYLRGQAYLGMHQGKAAATEFQKFLDYRFIVSNSPLGALAQLGLARAYLLQHEAAKARASYVKFLALWKGADPDIPLLTRAKAEYANSLLTNPSEDNLSALQAREQRSANAIWK